MPQDPRHVTILLCTYQGARFLEAQLESLLDQTHRNWSLWVSDDGSTDGTREILTEFLRRHGDRRGIRLIEGPRRGAACNFLSLLSHPDLSPGWIALADQDDIWLRGKLARGLRKMPAGETGPAVYGARSFHMDADGRRLASTPILAMPVFETAMMQNVIAGNTMLLNPAAHALVRQAGVTGGVPFHDWWIALLTVAAGGLLRPDRQRVLLYRQHRGNLLGASRGLHALSARLRLVLGGTYGDWIEANARALLRARTILAPENLEKAESFLSLPRQPGSGRVRLIRRLGLRRQSGMGTLLIALASAAGRI